MKPKFCPSNCIHLDLDEKKQNELGNDIDHWCNRYASRLFHFSYHPNIVRYDSCTGPEFKTDHARIQEMQKLASVPCGASTSLCSLSGSSTSPGSLFNNIPGGSLIRFGASFFSSLHSIKANREASKAAIAAYECERNLYSKHRDYGQSALKVMLNAVDPPKDKDK